MRPVRPPFAVWPPSCARSLRSHRPSAIPATRGSIATSRPPGVGREFALVAEGHPCTPSSPRQGDPNKGGRALDDRPRDAPLRLAPWTDGEKMGPSRQGDPIRNKAIRTEEDSPWMIGRGMPLCASRPGRTVTDGSESSSVRSANARPTASGRDVVADPRVAGIAGSPTRASASEHRLRRGSPMRASASERHTLRRCRCERQRASAARRPRPERWALRAHAKPNPSGRASPTPASVAARTRGRSRLLRRRRWRRRWHQGPGRAPRGHA
jgi:hypothetical protein